MVRFTQLTIVLAALQAAVGCDADSAIDARAAKSRGNPSVELHERSASVGGVVVDLDGQPVANVTVSAWERSGYSSIPFGPAGPPPPTDTDGRFLLTELPNVPLKLMAYREPPSESREHRIHFPANVFAEPGEMDIRIKLDPKLQRPLP